MSSTDSEHTLSMTVHTMPGQNSNNATRSKRGRLYMLLVLLACAAPVIASYFTFYVIQPKGGNSYGTLIPTGPAHEMPALTAQQLDGQNVALRSLRGQWLLVSVASAQCPQQCQEHLYLQRQLREMLGREKDRLDWVWFINDQAPLPGSLQAAAAQAGALRVDGAQLAKWLQAQSGPRLEDHLYLIDPMGNWMMRFPANLGREDAKKAYRDINRLLRASASWDRAGRGNPAP